MRSTWPPSAWERLGHRIRNERDAQGLSRRALAALSGVSEKAIQMVESGRTPQTRWPQSVALIAQGLGWAPGSPQQILDGHEPTPVEPQHLTAEPLVPGPALVFITDADQHGCRRVVRADHEPPEDPRDRALLRALLVHALALLDIPPAP